MIKHEYLELFNQSSIKKDIDMAYDTDSHITNSDMVSGTFSLNESAFATKELRFGSLVASELSVKLYNTVPNLMDKELEVGISLDNDASNPLKIGKFKVLSDKPTTDRLYKQIKAYDGLYEIINADVSDWYENLTFPMTLKKFRDSFFAEVGIEQVSVTLVNDNMNIEKTISTNSLSGRQVLSAICELNGAIGRINRDGKFEYVVLDANPSNRITIDNIASKSGSYEDYDSQPITKVQIRQTTDDIGTIVGEDGNTYIMQDNFLVYGKSANDLTTIATNLLSVIEGISYTPFNIKVIYGNPCYEIGDAITVVTKNKTFNSYIFNRTLKGIQAMTDTIKADGVEYYTENLNSANVQIQQLKRQTNELTRTVEETKSTITSIETIAGNASEVAQKANQTATSANTTANNANTVANQANTKADDIAEDLENNYSTTVEMQSQIKQSADSITSTVSKTYATQESVKATTDNLQQQIDGAIETFTGSTVPTLSNSPAKDWTTTAIKDTHIGDLYIVNSSGGNYAGFYYRFEKRGSTYQWVLLKDNEVTKALQDAKEANDKAQAVANNLANNYSTTTQMNSAITQSAENITSTVSKTYSTKTETATAKSEAISTASADATTKANNALASAKADTDNKLKSYSTTAQMNSAIEQSASSIKSTVSATYTTKEEFGNLEIGGRNLVVGSATHNFKQYSISPYVGAVTVVDDTDAISKKHIEIKCTTAGNGFFSATLYRCKVGTTYTYSFWAKCSVAKSGTEFGFKNGGQMNINLTTEWQYYKYTFTANNNQITAFVNYLKWNANEIFYIRDFKLEEGNKATTWTPAPEDVDSSISSVDTKATNAQSTANTANSKATTNANNITALTTRVATAESSIEQNADKIELRVKSTDYTGTTIASKINQSASTVAINANHIKLEGLVTANSNFKVLTDGSVVANNGKFTGEVNATALTAKTVTAENGFSIEMADPITLTEQVAFQVEPYRTSSSQANLDIELSNPAGGNIRVANPLTVYGAFAANSVKTTGGVDLATVAATVTKLTTITTTALSGTNFTTYFSTVDINRLIKIGQLLIFEFRGLVKTDIPNNTNFTFASTLSSAGLYDATIEAYTSNRYMTTTPVRRFAYFNDSNTIRLGGGFTSGSWVHMNGIAILKSL